jgi:branched-chain amino acid transport system ATP-binding protein
MGCPNVPAAPRLSQVPTVSNRDGGLSIASDPFPRTEVQPATDALTDTTLSATGVTVRFGALVAVDHVDLVVRQTDILGLIGPNGAGKTTLVNAITGFEQLTSGEVRLGARTITRKPAHQRARLGIVRTFQSGHSFGRLTAFENVEAAAVGTGLRRRSARQRATELLDFMNLSHRADVNANALPHGDERRLEVARALAMNPRYLILDEPAAGLDERESDELMDAIRSARSELQCGIVLIDHDMRVIMQTCEQIQVLNYGKTISHGTPAEVRNDPAVVAAYLGAQPV